MDIEDFKNHHWWEKFHKGFGLGPALTPLFLVPYTYFCYKRNIKLYLGAYLGLGLWSVIGATAAHGLWLVEVRK